MNDAPTTSAPLDPLGVLAGRWRTILVGFLLGAAAGVAYALLAAPWYRATLTVVPSQRPRDSSALGIVAKLPGGLDSMPTDVQRIQAVLASASVADAVIAKFHLLERYGVSHIEQARETLGKLCTTSVDRQSGVVSLSCEDKVPEQAMQMAAYYGEVGNQVFGRVNASSAREERKFLEAQVDKARSDVDEASRQLRAFQEEHKIIDLPEQSKAVIGAMATMEGELVSKQLELSYLSNFSSRTEASVVQLRQQIAALRSKLQDLEAERASSGVGSAATGSGSAAFFPGAMNVPSLRFELERLLREQKVKDTVFAMVTQRYEMAKIDEARDTSTFQILDSPTLPTFPSRPRKKRAVALAAGAGAGLACVWIVLPVWWRRRRPSISAR
ncbi:MAG: hypothetical protein JO257_08125 [Deltaproteobacteria bacterium]|nr:hypothetical protein [Deltaproteobacteria bacterium]